MKWIDATKELPPPKLKVKISYGFFGIYGSMCESWMSEGWILPSGTWSIKRTANMPKFPQKPTHWSYIND